MHWRNKIVILLGLLFFLACSNNKQGKNKVTVAVAANLKYAMDDIALAFEKKYSVDVEVSSGSSGTLTAQVKNGAPFDLFISANLRYPDKLFADGFASDKPKIYALGNLILWSFEVKDLEDGLDVLKDPSVVKVAVANPETAPYGIAGIEALKNAGLYSEIEEKLVYGESIGQVNQYIKSGAVNIGLTSMSGLYSLPESKRGYWADVDPQFYKPIEQGIVMLKEGTEKNKENTELFYNFMFTEEVQKILKEYGYGIK